MLVPIAQVWRQPVTPAPGRDPAAAGPAAPLAATGRAAAGAPRRRPERGYRFTHTW